MTPQELQEIEIGEQIIKLLNLKVKNNKVETSWGSKTVMGLGSCILAIIEATPEQEEFQVTEE